MKSDEAKFILSAYRPDGADAADARLAEAMAQAERDPALAAWFQDSRRFDDAMSEALDGIRIPPELRTNILAGGKISRPHWGPTRRAFLALAASIVLLALLGGVWWQRAPRLDQWQRSALAFLETLERGEASFDMESQNVAVLQSWLEGQRAPSPVALPEKLRALPSLGCKTIDSAGEAVSIICFKMRTGEVMHLAVTEPKNQSPALVSTVRFVEDESWHTASWNARGHAYMLATKGSVGELRAIVSDLRTAARGPSSGPLVALGAISR